MTSSNDQPNGQSTDDTGTRQTGTERHVGDESSDHMSVTDSPLDTAADPAGRKVDHRKGGTEQQSETGAMDGEKQEVWSTRLTRLAARLVTGSVVSALLAAAGSLFITWIVDSASEHRRHTEAFRAEVATMIENIDFIVSFPFPEAQLQDNQIDVHDFHFRKVKSKFWKVQRQMEEFMPETTAALDSFIQDELRPVVTRSGLVMPTKKLCDDCPPTVISSFLYASEKFQPIRMQIEQCFPEYYRTAGQYLMAILMFKGTDYHKKIETIDGDMC